MREAVSLKSVLVILLVVLVAAVLVAVFVARSRETAYVVQCRSNLRSLGLALTIYCSDNYGNMPSWPGVREEFHGWTRSDVDDQAQVIPQGLGLLLPGGYYHDPGIVCPGTMARRFVETAGRYAGLFQMDWDDFTAMDAVLRRRVEGERFPDGDGRMDLGGEWNVRDGGSVVVSTYWLRVSDVPGGRTMVSKPTDHILPPVGIVSDTVLGWTPVPGVPDTDGRPVFISNHDRKWNVLFSDGSVRTFLDPDDAFKEALRELKSGVSAEDRSNMAFGGYFDLLKASE